MRAGRMIRLKVKEVAESKKITMAKLSRIADLNYGTIRAIYENPNRDVAVTTLEKIAKALKVDVTDLYEILPDNDIQ
jgi:DNA-binding Xre family transcriptional regulator